MAKNTNQSWIHRYRFHIVFRLQNSPKVRVTFGLILLGIDKILWSVIFNHIIGGIYPCGSCCNIIIIRKISTNIKGIHR